MCVCLKLPENVSDVMIDYDLGEIVIEHADKLERNAALLYHQNLLRVSTHTCMHACTCVCTYTLAPACKCTDMRMYTQHI